MKAQFRGSLILLILLGALFAVPIVGKTFSAHGAFAAVGTALLVIFAVLIGPLSFALARIIEPNLFNASIGITNQDMWLALLCSLLVLVLWYRRSVGRTDGSVPYLAVAAWALMGAYFCIYQVFTHIA